MRRFKTTITILILMLLAFSVNAQKIKVKRGQVLLDKVPVVNIKVQGMEYIFTALTNDKKIIAEYKVLRLTKENVKKWLVVYNSDKSKSTEVEMEYFSITMSNKKAVAELLAKKYNLITTNGIENTDAFFAVERPNLTKEYNDLLKSEIAIQKEIREELANININVDYDLRRIFTGRIPYTTSETDRHKREANNYPNMLGSYSVKPNVGINGNIYTIYDLDKNKVAIASPSSLDKIEVFLPFEKTSFIYLSENRSAQRISAYEEGQFVKEIVEQLYLKNVLLGHQLKNRNDLARQAYQERKQEEYKRAKANSANIYFTKGYVIDKKKGKKEGEIQFIIEKIKDPNEFANVVDLDEANLGKKVVLKYTDKKNKTKLKTYKSKNGEKFCVDKNGEETCFRGLKVKGKGLELVAGGISSLNFDISNYYEIVKETPTISIYKEVNIPKDEFIIKINSEDKGYKFNTRNREKNIEKLMEYLGSGVDKSDLEGLNYANLNDVKKLVELYNKKE